MGHTPTPWYFDGDGVYSNVDCEGAPLAHVLSMGYDNEFRNIDARHIVAAVNACQGIRTEALEHRVHLLAAEDDTISLLNAQLAAERSSLFAESQRKKQLEQQVAELVQALEGLLDDVSGCCCTKYNRSEARAVIQKVRGGE